MNKQTRTKLARSRGGWVGRRPKPVGALSIKTLLLLLGIDLQPAPTLRARPCRIAGCPRRRKCYVPLWKRKPSEIYDTLHNARRLYRERVKQLHPDHGGDGRTMVELAQTWRRLQKIFERHGYRLDDGQPHHD